MTRDQLDAAAHVAANLRTVVITYQGADGSEFSVSYDPKRNAPDRLVDLLKGLVENELRRKSKS